MSMLISHEESFVIALKEVYGLDVSPAFVHCANLQLTPLFVKLTGITPSKNVNLMFDFTGGQVTPEEVYTKDQISGLRLNISVRAYSHTVIVVWESISGVIYDINDPEIPCEDIKFAFYKLEPLRYHKILHQGKHLPFEIDELGFAVEVEEIAVHTTISLFLKEESMGRIDALCSEINAFLSAFKLAFGKRKEKLELHNWKVVPEMDTINCEIDTGLTGYQFFQQMLSFLSKQNAYSRVVIR